MSEPWKLDGECEKHFRTRWLQRVVEDDLRFAAHVFGDTREQAIERAKLVAAAGDLLAACEAYYFGRKDPRECERMMGDAIDKARPMDRAAREETPLEAIKNAKDYLS